MYKICKACQERKQIYRDKNRQMLRDKQKDYYYENIENELIRHRKYRELNTEHMREKIQCNNAK